MRENTEARHMLQLCFIGEKIQSWRPKALHYNHSGPSCINLQVINRGKVCRMIEVKSFLFVKYWM